MNQITHPWQACAVLLFRPSEVFAKLAKTANWAWLPFALVVAATILPVYYYFEVVDFQWYKDSVIHLQFANISPAEQRAVSLSLDATKGLLGTVFSPFLLLIIMVALLAGYLNIATRKDEHNLFGFTDWYGFVWWTLLPTIPAALISAAVLCLSDSKQVHFADISPTALSSLIGLDITSDWFSLASSVKLETLWSLTLIAIGIGQWTQLSQAWAYCIAFVPAGLIGLIWAIAIIV